MPLLLVVGYGPGVSHATAERFGREGYAVALIGRTRGRVEDGASQLQQLGIDAHAYVLDTRPDQISRVFAVGIDGLLAAVQTTLDDLKAHSGAAVLVANGGLGDQTAAAEQATAAYNIDGTSLEAAAKSKLVGILAERLRPDGMYVGEVIIGSAVRTPASAPGTGIDPHAIADRFWSMATERDTVRTRFE